MSLPSSLIGAGEHVRSTMAAIVRRAVQLFNPSIHLNRDSIEEFKDLFENTPALRQDNEEISRFPHLCSIMRDGHAHKHTAVQMLLEATPHVIQIMETSPKSVDRLLCSKFSAAWKDLLNWACFDIEIISEILASPTIFLPVSAPHKQEALLTDLCRCASEDADVYGRLINHASMDMQAGTIRRQVRRILSVRAGHVDLARRYVRVMRELLAHDKCNMRHVKYVTKPPSGRKFAFEDANMVKLLLSCEQFDIHNIIPSEMRQE